MTTGPFLTRDVGQAERSMRALLDAQLTDRHLSFAEWTVLAFLGDGPARRSDLVRRQVAGHVALEPAAAAAVDRLLAAHLVQPLSPTPDDPAGDPPLRVTTSGAAVVGPLSETIRELTRQLHAGLSPADVEVTRRTLAHLARRAQALAGGARPAPSGEPRD